MGLYALIVRVYPAGVMLALAALLVGCLGSSPGHRESGPARGVRESDSAPRPGAACESKIGVRVSVPARAGKVAIGGYANLVSVGEGYLWVPVAAPVARKPEQVTLVRVEVRTGQVRRYRLRNSGEVRVTVGAGAVWLADPQTRMVTRLDVATGRRRTVRPFHGDQAPREIEADANGVWVVPESGAAVAELDPRSARVRRRVRMEAAEIGDVALDGRHAWFSTTSGDVVRVDRRSGRVAGSSVKVGATALDIDVGEGQVWVDLGDSDRLARLDAGTGQLLGRVPSGGSVFAIAIGFGSVWATNYGPDTVTRLHATTGGRIGEPLPGGTDPKGVATGAGSVWIADAGDCTLTRIAP
jgi:DNA-binding beta-propeller fold protein YncE